MLVWPSELPQRLIKDGYSQSMPDSRLRVPMESGPAKMRRRYSSAVTPVAGSIDVSVEWLGRFDRFWVEDTKYGVLPFLMPDQVYDGLPLRDNEGEIITDEKGVPITVAAWWVVRFGEGVPNKTNLGGPWYRVSFNIEVLP